MVIRFCRCAVNGYGVMEECTRHEDMRIEAESWDEFFPDWEYELAQYDARQNGTLITERDLVSPDTEDSVIRDWDIFIEMERETW
jgi:hypothetical protein